MSQEPNTTNDTSAKPRLIVPGSLRKPAPPPEAAPSSAAASAPATPPPAGNAAGTAAAPRLSFAPKKRSETPFPPAPPAPAAPAPAAPPPTPAAPPPPPRIAAVQETKVAWHRPGHEIPPPESASEAEGLLKRPPPGTRLVASSEASASAAAMPPPLNPSKSKAGPEPYKPNGQLSTRSRLPLLIAVGVMALICGGQFYYIITQDEAIVAVRNHQPPVVVKGANSDTAPIEVTNNGGVPQNPTEAYLQKLNPAISSGSHPLLIIDTNSYLLGNFIGPRELGLRWTELNDKTKTLVFSDKTGQRYVLKF